MTPVTPSSLAPLAHRVRAPETAPVPPATLGLRWRPLERADAAAWHGLVAAIEDADQPPYRTDLDEVEERFDAAWRDWPQDSLVGVDAEGNLRAYGTVEVRPGDATALRAFLDGGVHPEVRGRGIGRAVLAWQDARGRQKLAASGKELPARLAAFCDDGAPGTERLLRAGGFEPRRYYRSMRRDLAAPLPVVELGPGLRLAPWSPELDEQVRLAHNDAFRYHGGSQPATRESWGSNRAKFAPSWSFVVVDDAAADAPDGTVVAGYALSDRYEQDWAVAGYTSGYTATLGVRRAYRGRRLAPALLAASMAAFRDDGMQYAELDVDTENPSGAHGLYARLGYEVTHGSALYSIEL